MAESSLLRECQYLIMCDEIDQHDQFIRQQIDQYWEGGEVTRFFKKWVFPNFTALFAIALIIMILFWDKDYSTAQKLMLASVTPIITVLMEWMSRRFNKS